MTHILEYFFRGELVFPMEQEEEGRFAALDEETRVQRDGLREYLTEAGWEKATAYLKLLEEFHDRERRMAYENGFLLAAALCLEVSARLKRLRL